jgi:hypothetical protein
MEMYMSMELLVWEGKSGEGYHVLFYRSTGAITTFV